MSQLLSVMASYMGGNQTRNLSNMNTNKSNTDDGEPPQIRIDLESVQAFDELVSSLEWYERQRKLFDQAAFNRFAANKPAAHRLLARMGLSFQTLGKFMNEFMIKEGFNRWDRLRTVEPRTDSEWLFSLQTSVVPTTTLARRDTLISEDQYEMDDEFYDSYDKMDGVGDLVESGQSRGDHERDGVRPTLENGVGATQPATSRAESAEIAELRRQMRALEARLENEQAELRLREKLIKDDAVRKAKKAVLKTPMFDWNTYQPMTPAREEVSKVPTLSEIQESINKIQGSLKKTQKRDESSSSSSSSSSSRSSESSSAESSSSSESDTDDDR